jgi:hypothetical protein
MISRAVTSWVAVRVGDQSDDGRRVHGTAIGHRIGHVDGSSRASKRPWRRWGTYLAGRVWRATFSGQRTRAHRLVALPDSVGNFASSARGLSCPLRGGTAGPATGAHPCRQRTEPAGRWTWRRSPLGTPHVAGVRC